MQFFTVILLCGLCSLVLGFNSIDDSKLLLAVDTPSHLKGSYSADGINLSFDSQSSSLILVSNGHLLFNLIDYGSFVVIRLENGTVFALNNDNVSNVLDLNLIKNFESYLPKFDHSILFDVDANRDIFSSFARRVTLQNTAALHLATFFLEFRQSAEAKIIVDLSLTLASKGISSITHPSAMPLHMIALRIFKTRQDIVIDNKLVESINALYQEPGNAVDQLSDPEACELADICGNECFGRCGGGCTCWSWVCGDCLCHYGCQQHDCCCSCLGTYSMCCINMVPVRCDGYNNDCQWPQ